MWQLPEGIQPENILIYLRKSRTDDPTLTVEEVLAKHEQMLNDWVKINLPEADGPVPESNRFREVVSGETLASRPAVQNMLRLIEQQQYKALLIVEPQRLSRGDLEDIGRLVKLLRYSNTIVITLQYTYDLRDERDRDLFERELKRGNEFLEYQKRIMMNGRLASARGGNFSANRAPYGYNRVAFKEGKRKCHTLEPDPEKAPVVKMIFEMYSEGLGASRICGRLEDLHIPGPGGGRWIPASVHKILGNEHYLGKIVWNKRAEAKIVQDGEIVKTRPRAENYLVFEGKHPAIVSQELWDAVEARRGLIPPNKKASNFVNVLAGLLYCSECGRVMIRRGYNHKQSEEQRAAPRMMCQTRHCATASAFFDDVMAEVVKTLQSCIEEFEVQVDQGVDDSIEVHRQMIERLEKRLQDLQELELRQWDEKTKGEMPAHVFARLNGATLQEIEEVQQALCTARESMPEPIDLRTKLVTFRTALYALQDPEAPAREKNALLKACIERIEYRRPRRPGSRGSDEPFSLHFELRL